MRRRLAGMVQKSSEFWISAPTEDRQGGGRSTRAGPGGSDRPAPWLGGLLVMLNLTLIFTGTTGMDLYGFYTLEPVAAQPLPLVLSTLLNLGMVFRPTVPMITFARVKTPDKVPGQPTGLSTEALYIQPRPSYYDPTADSPYITNYQLWKLAKCAKLTADFPTQHNKSEYTVAVDGDTGLIGTYRGDDSGTAGVFIRGSEFGRWTLAAKLTASDADDQDII